MALTLNRSFRGRGWVRAAILIPWAIPTVVASADVALHPQRPVRPGEPLPFRVRHGVLSGLAGPSLGREVGRDGGRHLEDLLPSRRFCCWPDFRPFPTSSTRPPGIDGASPWAQFRRITLPLLKPAILVTLLFRTMDAFRVFDLVFVMTPGRAGQLHARPAVLRLSTDVHRGGHGIWVSGLRRGLPDNLHRLAVLHRAMGTACLRGRRFEKVGGKNRVLGLGGAAAGFQSDALPVVPHHLTEEPDSDPSVPSAIWPEGGFHFTCRPSAVFSSFDS